MAVKRKGIYELKIDKLAYGGKGLGKIEDLVVFVPYSVPGDIVKIRVGRKRKSYAEARIQELVKPSLMRIEPKCHFFTHCGGCKWQNVPYEEQLKAKQQIVQESYNHISGLEVDVLPTVPAPEEFAYRNKMEFTFSDVRWLLPDELSDETLTKKNALGFHAPGAFDRVMDIEHCDLQNEEMNGILNDVRDFIWEKGFELYHLREQTGLIRFIIMRKAHFTGQIMVNIITTENASEKLTDLAEILKEKYPNIKSIINGVSASKAQVAFTESETVLYGENFIMEELDDFKFKISANSFFQTNSRQALALYNLVKKYAGLTGKEVVWDLYGGTGTIAIFLSKYANKVVSVEMVDSAIADGKLNAALNNIDNVEYVHGDMRDIIHDLKDEPDVVITDPPRDGMHPKVVQSLIDRKPPKIVYVSCNPTTMARDLTLLKDHYNIKNVQPVDMFPQTYHIETIALLEVK